MNKEININKELQLLGVEKLNYGICTGTVWEKTNGERKDSFSPSDGKHIASIKMASKKDFNVVVETAKSAFKMANGSCS